MAHAFFPERLFNHCQSLSRTFPRYAQNLMHTRCRMRNRRPDTRLQINGRKNQHILPAAWNSVHQLPGYVSIMIYRCIALLRLLYRVQRQPRKLWISAMGVLLIAATSDVSTWIQNYMWLGFYMTSKEAVLYFHLPSIMRNVSISGREYVNSSITMFTE
jgi:hypothetical protein